MIEDIKYHFVNWKTGMQVSVDHFLDLEKAIVDRLRDVVAVRMTSFNFGILPFYEKVDEVLDVEVVYSNDATVRLELKRCKAITRAGNRVDITSNTGNSHLNTIFNANSQSVTYPVYYLIVGIQPFEAYEFGVSDPNEPFDRPPYRVPRYGIRIIPEKELLHADYHRNYLPVKRFEFLEDKLVDDPNYIVPSVSMNSSEILKEKHKRFLELLQDINKSAIKIIQIVRIQHKEYEPKIQGEDYDLANFFSELCNRINLFIAAHLAELENVYLESPPVYTINFYRQLAHITQSFMNSMMGIDEMFKYIKTKTDLEKGKIENDLSQLILKKYDHFNIRDSMVSIENYLNTITTILKKLDKLDYIGYKDHKKKDPIVYKEKANEREIQGKQKRKESRFLAE